MDLFVKPVFRMSFILISFLATLLLIIVIVIRIYSPGKPTPFLDETGKLLEGSLSEKVFVNINGLEQGMFIQSKDLNNPVLLYVHGGIPDYFLSKKFPTGLEEHFTVVWWEQRGSGLSYNAGITNESMTLEHLISDTKEVTNYLRKRFGQEKIYLMGRSGGTFIGIIAAAQSPELYHAYIGVGQMSNHFESEKMAYQYMLKKYRDAGNRRVVRKLEAAPITDKIPHDYLQLRDKAMHSIGIGTTRDMRSIITGIFLPSLSCRDYTFSEKIKIWRGKARAGVHPLWDTILSTDLSNKVPEIGIPIYFFHGIFDYTVSYNLAKEYFEKIKAPVKGFYTFENSAHSPIFEEPDRVNKILIADVLAGRSTLADK
ncbi:MAG: alpha/beta hydrolase [Bacteroidetes bacterium HGW-Bacteroidetes-5]|nr:MAG: alpha/beta hydrolase [Bacteroidetes bacterium HGW-Bacteroidetes-5]